MAFLNKNSIISKNKKARREFHRILRNWHPLTVVFWDASGKVTVFPFSSVPTKVIIFKFMIGNKSVSGIPTVPLELSVILKV